MATETQYSDVKEHGTARPSPSSSAPASEDKDELSLLDLLIVLAEGRWIIVSVTAVLAVSAALISLVLPARYTATVVLLPPQQSSSMASELASSLGNLGPMAAMAGSGLSLKNPNDMYVAMLQSQTVEDAMVKRYGLMKEYHAQYLSDARSAFEHAATIDGKSKDGLIHISIQDRNPQRAAELANGYVDQFRDLSAHLAISEASQRRLFFEQQMEQAKDKLENAEEALEQTEQTTGMIQLDSQARALIESAVALRGQIAAKEVEIQVMRTYATSENAGLVQAQQGLVSLRAQLGKLAGSEDSANSLILPRGKVPAAGLEYVRKLRDVKYYETIYDILARQWEMAKVDEAKEGSLIQVLDPAILPDRRSFPRRTLIVICTTAVGLFIGIFIALLRSVLKRAKDNPETSRKLAVLKRELALRKRERT